MNHFKILFILLLMISSCRKEEGPVKDCVDFPDTLDYILTAVNGTTPITLSFQDLDGEGGNAPTITVGTLTANTTYIGEIQLSSQSTSYVEDWTAEIVEEAEEHQFFYQTTGGIAISYNDNDANGNPIGIRSTLITDEAGNGTITITLRHEPDKNASGVTDGDITNAGGETDIEVTFEVTVM